MPGFIGAAHAQDIDQRNAVQSIASLQAAKRLRTPSERKVTSQLLDAFDVAKQLAKNGDPAASEPVTVDIRADVTSELLTRIQDIGGTVVNSVPKYRAIRARLPLSDRQASGATLMTARPGYGKAITPQVGS